MVPPAGTPDQFAPPHEFGRPAEPEAGAPFGNRLSGNGESGEALC